MKFRNFGRVALALAASLALTFGAESCTYNYTESYIFITGSQYNQVGAYRQSNNDGQLRPEGVVSSGGTDPVRAELATGGRYLYVLNEGKPTRDSSGNITWTGANISVFAVGGRGNLSYQLSYPSQGEGSMRLQMSVDGSYLYVLDQYQPGSTPNVTPASATMTTATPCWDAADKMYRPAGDITAYQINASTGRLFLVQNLQQQDAQGTPLTYFPVGCGPVDFHLNSGYLYTGEASDPASGATQVVYAYAASPTTGQLTQVPGGAQPIGTTSMSYIDGSSNGEWIYILDNGANKIYTFQPGANGLLSAVTGGSVDNVSTATGMDALTTDSQSKYLYVANTQSTGLNQSGSVLSIFNITPSTGVLTPATPSSYGVGSTPVCVFEDPSHQYVYTADAGSSTVTGAAYDPNTGNLRSLTAGSTWNVVGTPTWCLYSSNTY